MQQLIELWERMPQIPSVLEGIKPMDKRISGTAFFPGGLGLYPGDGTYPHELPKTVMILGHDFDTENGFKRSWADKKEDMEGPTWGNLLQVLSDSHIRPEECFFTNFFTALRTSERNTGAHPGRRSKEYVKSCQHFLLDQLRVVRPSLLLVLGTHVPSLIAPMAKELEPWKRATVTSIYKSGTALLKDVDLGDGIRLRAVVSLTHPSLRPVNLWRRGGSAEQGQAFEMGLIHEAKRLCGLH